MSTDPLWTALKLHGPLGGPALQARLGISQPKLSRALRALQEPVLVVGKARRTTYAARRAIDGLTAPIPVYEVPEAGPPRLLCRLHPIEPGDGQWVEPVAEDGPSGFFDDLPWFLHDLRPAGYLGQLIPQRHPELELPPDVLRWRADDVLRYLSTAGSDGPGALIVGDPACAEFLARAARPPPSVAEDARPDTWPRRAEDVLLSGPPGSSAAGERPKFLAAVDRAEGVAHVLVKFSPPCDNPVAQRIADLLLCESLALEAIAEAGVADAASGRVLESKGRVFLELDRFDRVGASGRRGLLSLQALDAEHVGSDLSSWSGSTRVLAEDGRISATDHQRVRWLECFGRWIGNADMHFGNLAFFARADRPHELAPAYDMGPMAWFPRGHELVAVRFEPPAPHPSDGDIAHSAWTAARGFWSRAAEDPRISDDFHAIAQDAGRALDGLRPVLAHLPTR